MSIQRQPDSISENLNSIQFTLRYPPGAEKPTITSTNVKSSCYIKIAYSPNIFETILPYQINTQKTKIVINQADKRLEITFHKIAVDGVYEIINYKKPTKDEIKSIKNVALTLERSQTTKSLDQSKNKRETTKKSAIHSAMNLDMTNKAKIEDSKKLEIKNAFKQMTATNLDEDDSNLSVHEKADKAIDYAISLKEKEKLLVVKCAKHEKQSNLAPIRESNVKISVDLSKRIFPTAARSSMMQEEQEWLAKQASFRKKIDIQNPDLKEHEKDPIWLKNKGNNLFKSENYSSASHAYSLALNVTPNDPSLYLNRSASFLKENLLHKCINDCQKAIELLVPAVESNKKLRAKAFSRRGAAFGKLGMFDNAIDDIDFAFKLTNDQSIKRDLLQLQQMRQTVPFD